MKYIVCAAPMLLCCEVVSVICLCGITVCIILDFIKAAKGGK